MSRSDGSRRGSHLSWAFLIPVTDSGQRIEILVRTTATVIVLRSNLVLIWRRCNRPSASELTVPLKDSKPEAAQIGVDALNLLRHFQPYGSTNVLLSPELSASWMRAISFIVFASTTDNAPSAET
jgi:hypothetical protein